MEYFNLLTDKSNLEENKERSHYFIGNVLNDKNLNKTLEKSITV